MMDHLHRKKTVQRFKTHIGVPEYLLPYLNLNKNLRTKEDKRKKKLTLCNIKERAFRPFLFP